MSELNEKKISIIMACYNEKIDWIEDSIQSILNQTYKNIELIIINDNPHYKELGQTLEKYREIDKRIIIHNNEKNQGLVASLNKGIELSKGYYIARMDSDDISYLNRLELQLKELENKELDFVMSGADYINEKGDIIGKSKNLNVNEKNIIKYLMYRNISIHPTWLFKKSILNTIKCYNDVLYAEDYDFICRVVLNKYKVGYISDSLLKYRIRNSGICISKRHQQEIISQQISKNLKNVYYRKKSYNVLNDIKNIPINKIENLAKINEEYIKYKNMLKENKKILAFINILNILMKCKEKRVEILNKLCYILTYKIYN